MYFRDVVFAVAGGVLFSSSQPPFFTTFLAYFCVVPLLFVLRDKNYRSAFMLTYIWGFTSNLLSLYWIALPTVAGMIGAVLILSLYNGLFGVVFSFIERRNLPLALAAAPILWTGMEFLRGFGRIGFPWMDIGYTQGPYIVIIQMADIIGHRGISFWVIVINILIASIAISEKRKWTFGLALLVVFAIPIGYGIWRLKQPPAGENIRIALMQGNISADLKWSGRFRRKNIDYYAAMIDSIGEKVDLIVLPETATAYYHRNHPEIVADLAAASERAGAPILTGTLDFDPADRKNFYYNAAMVITSTKVAGVYHKMNLVPMSEQIPFQDIFPFLKKIDLGGSHFARGKKAVVFDVDGMKFSSPICYEVLFGRSARRFALNGARFLANITNDGWFGTTPGPFQHANFCRFRAVENRFGIGRSAQTGISLIVDERGRMVGKIPLNTKGILVGDIPLNERTTFFTRIGDWVGTGSVFASPILLLLASLFKKI